MRTVYVAVITLFFIAFIIDTDAFYFIPVIISAGKYGLPGNDKLLLPFPSQDQILP